MSEHQGAASGRERRKHPRAGIELEAVLRGRTPDLDTHIEVVNFSVGGFLCWIDRPMEPMTKLGVHFQFPAFGERESRDIQALGVVVRCEPGREGKFRMAACFIDIDPSCRNHIRDYVEWFHATHEDEEIAQHESA